MGVVSSVLGPIDPGGLGVVLAAEPLLCAPPAVRANAGVPASEAAFERAAVEMPMLGALMLGAVNRDDRTLGVADAEAALAEFAGFADPGGGAVVALAGPGSPAAPESLAGLSRATGVAIVRGTDGSRGPGRSGATDGSGDPTGPDAVGEAIAADLAAEEHPAGAVGAIPLPSGGESADLVAAAGAAAHAAGAALVLAPRGDPWSVGIPEAPDPAGLERALAAVDATGLRRRRVVLLGAAACIAARRKNGAPAVGVDASRLDALLALGTAICFDDLGRIPNVRTAVSDHDIALAILRCAELGAGNRVLLSSGIRNKHRLTAFGGNGLEFAPQQFLPHLGVLGADAELVAGVGGRNAARILARTGEGS